MTNSENNFTHEGVEYVAVDSDESKYCRGCAFEGGEDGCMPLSQSV